MDVLLERQIPINRETAATIRSIREHIPLDGSQCMSNHTIFSASRYPMRRRLYPITGDSQWKIAADDIASSLFNSK